MKNSVEKNLRILQDLTSYLQGFPEDSLDTVKEAMKVTMAIKYQVNPNSIQ